jgi:hypothetical protein
MRLFASGNFTEFFKKRSLFRRVGTHIKLLLSRSRMQIKAPVTLWDQPLHACIAIDRRQAFQPVLQSVFCLLVTPQTLGRQNFLEVKKQVMIIWCKLRIVLKMLQKFPTRTVRRMCVLGGAAWVCTNVVPSLNNRHHFLTFPSFIPTSLHTSTTRL